MDSEQIVAHTPGRWYADSERPDWKLASICVYVDIEREDPTIVAEVSNNGELEGHAEANARLIAASPRLLAACKETLHRLSRINMADGIIADVLRAAIAEATQVTP